ncbi:type IX secretion system membrane protein PorP/SprF [Dokdonia sp. Hel_I_53]|uniref:PorP/SprF family type IX secretion system membrane protein n=1 Tax=Dokdonia sp. Hel_I_53 TaxID=1566287 RepID=UPI001199A5E1|nr:type IX secretion system membrane protein PorP/SprF [Dokdonia sp. Hel_I_53]TVZ51925.1 type IX secretion system PorP/SprF family membrane protein [Dokdonia sp. Hel_I_53]
MKVLVKYVLYVSLFVTAIQGTSQELNLPVFSQYLADSDFVVAPTYAGIGDNFRIRLNALTQWVGIPNAPDNQAFYADLRFATQSGLGLSLYNDRNGNTIQQGAKVSFAHHLTLDYNTKQYISFGLSGNVNSFSLDIDNFSPTFEQPTIDPFITDNRSETNLNFDVGVLYRIGEAFLSVNANNILPKDIERFDGLEPNLLFNLQLYGGYTLKTNNYSQWEPSAFYQLYTSDGRSSTDLNIKYRKFNRYNDYLWAGATYRFLNDQIGKPLSVGPMIGGKKSIFYASYAYQVTLNDMMSYNSGTHSITIGLDLLQGISDCPCTAANKIPKSRR